MATLTYHDPDSSVYVDLDSEGNSIDPLEDINELNMARTYLIPNMVVNGQQVQMPYKKAMELGLNKEQTPAKTDASKIFNSVQDLSELTLKTPELLNEVWDRIRERCKKIANSVS